MKNISKKIRSLNALVVVVLIGLVIALTTSLAFVSAAATPSISIDDESALIGDTFDFSVTFDNTGADPGYGPFIDLVFPTNGFDGQTSAPADGITFNNATYLGLPLTSHIFTFPDDGGGVGCVDHPLASDNTGAPLQVCGDAGDTFVVLELPFGSFVGSQTPAEVIVNATLSDHADPDQTLDITGRGGFYLGETTAIDDPTTDPSVVGDSATDSSSWATTSTITTELIRLEKIYLCDYITCEENEIATGPNNAQKYRINVDLPDGQTLTNFQIEDVLPDDMEFIGLDSADPAGFAIVDSPASPGAQVAPDNNIVVEWSSITGTTADIDAYIIIDFFIPYQDADGVETLPPGSGGPDMTDNDAIARGDWDPIDPRDAPTTVVSDLVPDDHTLEQLAVSTQKTVTIDTDSAPTGFSPGDVVEYEIELNMSDYFAMENLVLTDTMADGQLFDPSFVPELSITGGTTSANAPLAAANYNNVHDSPGTGNSILTINVSDELVIRGLPNQVLGGCVPAGGTGAGVDPLCSIYDAGRTVVTIKFHAIIQQAYTDSYAPGNPSVDHGDSITNSVVLDSDLLDVEDLSVTGTSYTENGSTGLEIIRGELAKSIYAVNGTLGEPTQLNVGDEVTYRLRYTLPSSSYEDIILTDFLNLPVFDATELSTVLDTTIDATAPPAGTVKYGPDEDLFSAEGQAPTITIGSDNTVTFTWAPYTDADQDTRVIDMLFTVSVQDAQYAPNFNITNQANASESGTQTSNEDNQIHQITVGIPELLITKGAVATDNSNAVFAPALAGQPAFTAPGSSNPRFTPNIDSTILDGPPITSDISDVDAGDIVTFAIVVENEGDAPGGAFDIQLKDIMPSGYMVPTVGGLNLSVTDGTGATISHTDVGGGSGLFDQGIELTDPGPTASPEGAIDDFDATDAQNIAIVTYDLEVVNTVEPLEEFENEASIFNFATAEGGTNYATNPSSYTDSAMTTTADVTADKTIIDTDINNTDTTGNNVSVGEMIQYQYEITVPEGQTSGVTLVDTLDPGLAFVGIDSITSSSGAVATSMGSWAAVQTGAAFATVGSSPDGDGREVTLDFGDITNSDTDNATAETITVEYTVIVINHSSTNAGSTHNNQAVLTWTGGDGGSDTQSATNITVSEPQFDIAKTISPDTGIDSFDNVTVTLTVDADGAVNQADAYNVSVVDDLTTTNFDYVGSLTQTGGPTADSMTESGGIITITWNQLEWDDATLPATFTFDASLDGTVTASTDYDNDVDMGWSSMPGDVSAPQSPHNSLSCERSDDTGAACGGAYNDHTDSATDTVTTTEPADPNKSIVATSEGHTSGADTLAIGEIVRFRVEQEFPEGTHPNVTFVDDIPNGFMYLENTVEAALVSNDTAQLVSSSLSGGTLNQAGDETTPVASITPSFAVPAANVGGSPFTSGSNVTFDFGTITNTDGDANNEFIVFEYNALVMNNAATSAGSTHTNDVAFNIDGTEIADGSAPTQTVLEPDVGITKTVTTAPVDAGDNIVYQITIENDATADSTTGFDFVFTDALDSYLTFSSFSAITNPGYATVDTSNTAGNSLDVRIDELQPGDSVTFEINATVNSDAPAGYIVPNTGYVAVTTLPGDNGTTTNPTGSSTPGDTGDGDGEQSTTVSDGANAPLGTPQIDKQAASPTTYTIGESVSFDIEVTLPEGETPDLIVTDSVPAGLAYLSHSVDTSTFTGTFENPPNLTQPAASPGADGEDVILDFGDVDTTAAAGTTDNVFVITLTFRVLNVAGNEVGDTLDNYGGLSYFDTNTSMTTNVNDPTPETITIAEPTLETTKSISSASTNIESGDSLTYVVRTTNTGTSNAYEWVLDDTLAPHTSYDSLTGCEDSSATAVPVTVTDGGTTLQIHANPQAGSFIAPADYVECTYVMTVDATVIGSSSFTNTVDADWSSAGGDDPNERTYDDGDTEGPYDNDMTDDEAQATFSTGDPGITKSADKTTATIGETINYTLTINAPIGEINNLVIEDTLPAGMIFNDDSVFTNIISATPTASSPNDGTAAVTVEWNFGDITVATSPIEIEYSATVANTSSSNDGVVQQNTVTMDWEDSDSVPQMDGSNFDVTLVEPELNIVKSVNVGNQIYGGTLEFTIDVTHSGASTADAQDVVISDTPDSGLTYVAGSEVLPAGWTIDTSGLPTIVFSANTVALGDAPQITYEVTIDGASTNSPGDVLTNGADLSWTSLEGDCSGIGSSGFSTSAVCEDGDEERDGSGDDPEDDYASSSAASVTVDAVDLYIDKDDSGTDVLPGDTVVYNLSYDNFGNITANGVVISETVPQSTTFDAAGSTPGWSCVDGSAAGTTCTFSLGSIAPSASGSVNFAITLTDPFDPTLTEVENSVTIADDGTQGEDADSGNNESDESTTIEIAELRIEKEDDVDPVYIDHNFNYLITVTNDGVYDATNVVINDVTTANIDILGAAASQGTCTIVDPQTVTCNLGTILSGDVATIDLAAFGATPGLGENTATVSSDQHDTQPEDNTVVEETFIDPADMVLVKAVSPTTAELGDTVTFTLTLTNEGPDVATQTVVTDSMPAGLSIVSVTPSKGSCTVTGQDIDCQIGTVAVNTEVVTITVEAQVQELGTFTNLASVDIFEYDPDTSNSSDVAAIVTVVEPVEDLSETGQGIRLAAVGVGAIIIVAALRLAVRSKNKSETA